MSEKQAFLSFRNYACEKIEQNLAQIVRCASLLSVDELWLRENEFCNSVGNLILHLNGNMRQWVVAGLGGECFERDRPLEFSQREKLSHSEILVPYQQTARRSMQVVAALPDEDLGREVSIQGYTVRMIVAVFHVVEHMSFHTGQIIHRTKSIRGVDLSLYDAQGQRLDANRGRP